MSQIKSKDRVRDLAEVFTNEREVKEMLNLIPLKDNDILNFKFLEPACGNGNFLIEILRQKIKKINDTHINKSMQDFEFYHIKAISTVYGIDICEDNVSEAIERLYLEVKSNIDLHKGSFKYSEGFFPLVRYILSKNIVIGDSINKPNQIELIDYVIKYKNIERRIYNFSMLTEPEPVPIKIIPAENFLTIGLKYQLATNCDNELMQSSLNFGQLQINFN